MMSCERSPPLPPAAATGRVDTAGLTLCSLSLGTARLPPGWAWTALWASLHHGVNQTSSTKSLASNQDSEQASVSLRAIEVITGDFTKAIFWKSLCIIIIKRRVLEKEVLSEEGTI